MEKQFKIAISINLDWPLRRYHELYAGIQEYATKNTNWILVWDHYPENALKASTDTPYYDGIIGRIKYDAYDAAKKFNIPVINTWFSSDIKDITSVFTDYTLSGEMAAEHLIKRGFRNFVNIDHRIDAASKVFYNGFVEAVKPYNCTVKRYLISRNIQDSSDLWSKFHNDFKRWSKKWTYPLGIVCSMSSLGPKITTRCQENGLRIPEDIAVVSSGNDLTYCEGFSPKISSVFMDHFGVGYESARLLDLKLQGKEVEKKAYYIPPKGFVARESTDSYAVEDDVVKTALRYIADNSNNNIQVIDVVDQVPVARRSLEVRFQKAVGHSIVDEINRLRITTLKRLLVESDKKINKLYRESGFSSPLHMRRVFSKYTDMTPGEFRKKNKLP